MTKLEKIRDTLKECGDKFREYEALHAAKGTLEGDSKARANAIMAEKCEQALSEYRS